MGGTSAINETANLPAQADIVIVGGGIVGLSAALYLAESGCSVVLCEKGRLGGEQSTRNWGWVRKLNRDWREIPLAIESLKIWAGLNGKLGADTGFRRTGIAFSIETAEQADHYERWLEEAQPYGIDAKLLAGSDVDELFPGATTRWKGALYCGSDGRAEPNMAVPAIAAAVHRAGGRIFPDCAVRGFERSAGAISAAITEHGPIRCRTVLVAAGVWSRRLLADLGLRMPQLKVKNSVARTSPVAGAPTVALWGSNIAFGRQLDGSYVVADGGENVASITPDSFRFLREFLPAIRREWSGFRLRLDDRFLQEWREERPVALDRISPYEKTRVLDPKPDSSTRKALARLGDLFPAFRDAEVVAEWAGLIDVTPDAIPVVSAVDHVPGLIVATGLSGHGFGVGPGVGLLAADVALGRKPLVDPAPFAFSRFDRKIKNFEKDARNDSDSSLRY